MTFNIWRNSGNILVIVPETGTFTCIHNGLLEHQWRDHREGKSRMQEAMLLIWMFDMTTGDCAVRTAGDIECMF